MAETGKTWRIPYGGQSSRQDGAFHLHLREGTTDVDDSWRIASPSAGVLGQTWLKGALSVTGHGRIEDLALDTTGQAVPALTVRGTLADTLGYEVRVDAGDAKLVRGQFEGTDLRRDFRAGDAISVNGHVDLVERVEQDGEAAGKRLYLTHGVPPAKMPTSGVKPQRDSALLVVHNGAGVAQLVVDKSGHVGIGISDPGPDTLKVQGNAAMVGTLHVTGSVTAQAFSGAVDAQHITTGTLDAARIPTLTVNHLPNLPASQITDGVLDVQRIPNLDAAKIASGTLHGDRIPALPASKITTGTLDAARLPNLPASQITAGELGVQRIPNLDAAKITSGSLNADRIPALPASKITAGTLDAARIPTLTVNHLPNLPASKITEGELGVQRIPNLDAAKITGGTLHGDRIPALPVAKISGLQAALDGKLNTAGGTIAGALTIKPSAGQAILSLQSGGTGYGILDLRYKLEDNKSRIGFTDGDGNWMTWSEFETKNLYVKGRVYAEGGLVFYWGPDRAWKVLDNRAGNLAGTGNTHAPSDIRFKTAVRPIRNALEKVMHLQGMVYHWGEPGLKYFTRNITNIFSAGPGATEEENQRLWAAKRQEIYDALAGEKIGLVAQEVESIVPEVIVEDEEGYKHIQYQQLTALLVEAIKEQNELIRGLSVKVAALEAI